MGSASPGERLRGRGDMTDHLLGDLHECLCTEVQTRIGEMLLRRSGIAAGASPLPLCLTEISGTQPLPEDNWGQFLFYNGQSASKVICCFGRSQGGVRNDMPFQRDINILHHARSALKPEFSRIGVRQCKLQLVE